MLPLRRLCWCAQLVVGEAAGGRVQLDHRRGGAVGHPALDV
jgi:hypothetical protein